MLVMAIVLLSGRTDPGLQQNKYLFVAAVGDIMMGTTYPAEKLPPQDGGFLFRNVKQKLKGADIIFGNLEGPLLDGGATAKCAGDETSGTCYAFRMPTRYADHLAKAGFNVVSTANNHILDFGAAGERSTRVTLQNSLIQPAGGTSVARLSVGGKKVAVAGFSFSRLDPWFPSVLEISRARQVVRELKEKNDIVIISFHAGPEGIDALHVAEGPEFFGGELRGETRRFAHEVVDAGADLLIGHGPHVLRGFEVYKNKLIAYSLGNFVTYAGISTEGFLGTSLILHAALDPDTGNLAWGKIVSLRLRNRGIPFEDKEHRALGLVRRLSAEDFGPENLLFEDSGLFYPSPLFQNTRAYFPPSGY
jgi:poly-gamma-glutamate capsule biosynthesis protein CapA/YwtB (metallophosphatase superfamily)